MENVGNVIKEGKHRAIMALVMLASILVYLAMLLYSGVHNWSLMTKGVPEDMLIWAALGVVALEVSAVFLPLALHHWTHGPLHRIAALAFYALDAGLIFLNVVLDYAIVSGSDVPGWMTMYLSYIVPATPIIAGMGWSILWLLDPAQRERATVENLRSSTREALAVRIANEAANADVNALVQAAASRVARQIVRETLGIEDGRQLPPPVIDAEPLTRLRVERAAIRGGNNGGVDPDEGDDEDGGAVSANPNLGLGKISRIYRMDRGRIEPMKPPE